METTEQGDTLQLIFDHKLSMLIVERLALLIMLIESEIINWEKPTSFAVFDFSCFSIFFKLNHLKSGGAEIFC